MANDTWDEIINTVSNGVIEVEERKLIDYQRTIWGSSEKDWALLPSVSFAGKSLVLVALGREGERRGLEVSRAFFGPVLSRALAPSVHVLPSGKHLFVNAVMVPDDVWKNRLETLAHLVGVRLGTRPIERAVVQPLSVLLRDFYFALKAGSEHDALEIRQKINSTGLLRGDNLEFLWVHQLATFGKWSTIYESEKFDDLCRTRRSKVISENLLQALWERDFASLSEPLGDDDLRNVFQKKLLATRYRDLLGSLDHSTIPDVRRLLALFFGEIGDTYRLNRLVKDLSQAEAEQLQGLSGLCLDGKLKNVSEAETQSQNATHPCVSLASQGDHLGVISFFETHAEDEIALGCAIESAAELGDTESAKRVIACIDLGTTRLPSKRVLQDALKFLRKQAQGDCAGWLDWAARAALEPWAGVFQSVSENSNVWSTDWCDNADLSKEFSLNLIEAFSGPNSLLLQQSMAFVLELVGENSSRSSISEIRSAALNILVNLEMSNAQIRNAFVSLISSYEDGNISSNDYVELLDAAILVWGAYGAVSSFAWFLDVIDQILLLPPLDKGKLQELISLSYSSLQSFGSNIDTSLHNLFCDMAEPFLHLERRSVDVECNEDNKWTKFDGLKIGIYSLLESMPELKAKLEALCPSAEFQINQEKVASHVLRSFAASCDLVLIHTSKAKHAATEVLSEAIAGERIYVAGRGRGSIINALLSWNPSQN